MAPTRALPLRARIGGARHRIYRPFQRGHQNYGTVSSASGAAIWNQFEDDYVNNTIHNYGVIETTANGGDAVVIGSATGNGELAVGV